MRILIVGAAMPFGPDTLRHKSIGGSETAQLMAGKALANQGHEVWQITLLPAPGEPDHIADGTLAPDGVRYIHIENAMRMICGVPHDMLIVSRDLRFANCPHQAKHAVFWAHDLATYEFMAPAIAATGWNIDEVWAVSNWHADQIAQITGYPRDRIFATRNGIVDVRDETIFESDAFLGEPERDSHTLLYAARPERGLEALVRPGGIMERLPEFKLRVAMYDHFPPHMKPLYDWCFDRIRSLPNVEFIGSLNQQALRREIAEATAYVYPTNFEETSCILARECIEQLTPIFYVERGALPETINGAGYSLNEFLLTGEYAQSNVTGNNMPEWGSDAFCQKFADMVRSTLSDPHTYATIQGIASLRNDLYWDGVVEEWTKRPGLYATPSIFSRAKSLVEDGDAIAALAFLADAQENAPTAAWGWQEQAYTDYLKEVYHFVDYDDAKMGAYYEEATKHWTAKYPGQHQGDPVGDHMWNLERHRFVRDHIARNPTLKPGDTIFEYGIAEGNLILNLARYFPQYKFVGCDFDELALDKAREYAAKHNITNFECFNTLAPVDPAAFSGAEVIVCCEVLEHVRYPWKHLDKLERIYGKPGSEVILSTPFGAFEAMQWSHFGHDYFRQHIWEFSDEDFKEMIGHKANMNVVQVSSMPGAADGRIKGHRCVFYTADSEPARELNLERKMWTHHARETVTAVIITMNAGSTLPRLLDSLWKNVDAVQFAVGPSDDSTYEVIAKFQRRYPWIPVRVIDVPAIRPGEFGFDDARNASIEGISTDWFLWIDSDEYLAGDIRKYIRSNALNSYGIHQHHFTLEPRGAPAQIDRPARLCRRGMTFFGKVHEHAETGLNGGPGYSTLLPDVDIGHTGYVDETTRRLRFERNFPFLVWDRQVNPDRHLGFYLWFRDIIHRMRYSAQQGDRGGALRLAQEAISFYEDNKEQIAKFGMGAPVALAYFSEAMRYLGRGRDVKIIVALDNQPVELAGQIEDTSQVLDLVHKMLQPELDKAKSPYWR